MVDDESNRTVTSTPGQKFGRRLRDQRERHQITLDAIASSTKIKMSLFAGLERGDIADWPAGIFQRAFVREYARAIGLAPEPVVAEFARAFAPESAPAENGTATAGELRLTLAHEPQIHYLQRRPMRLVHYSEHDFTTLLEHGTQFAADCSEITTPSPPQVGHLRVRISRGPSVTFCLVISTRPSGEISTT